VPSSISPSLLYAIGSWNSHSVSGSKKGNYDIYVVFTERCLELLAPEGLLGFIMPHKFWQASYGEGLRKIIADGRHLRSVIDFGHQQVFHGATTYTAIHILGKSSARGTIDYARFNELLDGVSQCAMLDTGKTTAGVVRFSAKPPAGTKAWGFFDGATTTIMNNVANAANKTLGDVADRLFQGVRTSKNEVFVLQIADASRGRYLSEELGREVELEPSLLKPFLSGDAIRRYYLAPAKAAAIFPYIAREPTGSIHLLDAKTLEKTCPLTWAYLRACEDVLRSREDGAMNHDGWYGYGRTQNLDLFGIPRILVPDMMEQAAFALDEMGNSAFVSGYGIIPKPEHSALLIYLAGLLNSALLILLR
jgi:hypothetical protein